MSRVRIACDNIIVMNVVIKCLIIGSALRSLQIILLIAATFDIEIIIFWIPLEENIIADVISRYNFKKLTNLGFQNQIDVL